MNWLADVWDMAVALVNASNKTWSLLLAACAMGAHWDLRLLSKFKTLNGSVAINGTQRCLQSLGKLKLL
jgi:hypothetical protein